MTEDKERLCRNIGKSEFITARRKIKTLLEAGYDRKYIHAKLKKDGVLTMSYSSFCVHFNKFKEERESALSGPAKVAPRTEGAPVRRLTKPEPFSIDRSRPVEDLM